MSKDTNIGEKIKELRNRLNLSQDRFAKKIGLTGKTISAYENGRCIPPLRILDKMTIAYGETFITLNSDYKQNLIDKLHTMKNYLQDLEKILF